MGALMQDHTLLRMRKSHDILFIIIILDGGGGGIVLIPQ